ncbi:hypothetical protein Kpol_505p39 [Vanderwaltozyma polyspora DSM 70294]|uniref:Kinesin motor domain-containing protein n=1 Tax=Vanderwaltozyma polyspora (strain ATCC 22028 / DSM 70294 / BCRC 21397 / CBS 2163 / NBRC 10782 / NRRL Y-8283 / UCD 57-17) TaxID=436907 RepID=A7TND0_VANPO|nr:uncharacterized protein Kpol_505p39 [Vanderwaltozyma polyspora DSM 70294]EDO16262.1 hypothetical protein Kpol_505p39 [Vanderwaltozyma polyspora DSM 70294]
MEGRLKVPSDNDNNEIDDDRYLQEIKRRRIEVPYGFQNKSQEHSENAPVLQRSNSNLTSFYNQNLTELNELQDNLFNKKTKLDSLKDELNEYKENYKEIQSKWENLRESRVYKQEQLSLKTNELIKLKDQFKCKEDFMNKEHALKLKQMKASNTSDISRLSNKYMSDIDKLKFEKIKKYEQERNNLLDEVNIIKEKISNNYTIVKKNNDEADSKFEQEKSSWLKELDSNISSNEELKKKYNDEVTNLTNDLNDNLNPKLNSQISKLESLKCKLDELKSIMNEKKKHVSDIELNLINKRQDIKNANEKKLELEKYIETTENELIQIGEILIKEETMRRSLHNDLQELRGNIRVFCRIRPPLKSVEDINTNHIKVQPFNDNHGNQSMEIVKDHRCIQKFQFDRIFDQHEVNKDVFDEIGQLVQSSLDGYNVCIFAYGQTGSGKTFTMLNPNDGMIPATIDHIFDWTDSLKERGWEYEVSCQFVEIYNENIIDLLREETSAELDEITNNGRHDIRHDSDKRITTITNIKTSILKSKDSVDFLIKKATKLRATATTAANERSSRSHSIFIIHLRGSNNITGESSYGILNLVDLAGSERLNSSQVEGARLRETQNINKSLSCLGDVIHALGSSDASKRHIPFRNSKLTYLLQYSLTGNSKTLMFVNISPTQQQIQETLNSLRFASKVNTTKMVTRSN